MSLVYNCNDDITEAAFIVGMQIDHSFYKHLAKHDVTNMKDILSRVQKYIQLEEATRNATNCSTKYKIEASHKTQGHSRGRWGIMPTSWCTRIPRRVNSEFSRRTLTSKASYWPSLSHHRRPAVGKAPEATPTWSSSSWSGGVLLLLDSWGHHTIQCYLLKKLLQGLARQEYLREFIFTPRPTTEAVWDPTVTDWKSTSLLHPVQNSQLNADKLEAYWWM